MSFVSDLTQVEKEEVIQWAVHPSTFEYFKTSPRTYAQMLIHLGLQHEKGWEPLSAQVSLFRFGKDEYLLDLEAKPDRALVKVVEADQPRIQKFRQERSILEKKLQVKSEIHEVIGQLTKEKNQVALVSTGGHSGLYVDGHIYDLAGNGKVSRYPPRDWIDHWGNKNLVVMQVDAPTEEVLKLKKDLEQDLKSKIPFSMIPIPGGSGLNCASFVTDRLKKSNVYHFPATALWCRRNSNEMAAYIMEQASQDPKVKAVYLAVGANHYRNWPVIKKYLGYAGIGVGGGVLIAGVLYAITH